MKLWGGRFTVDTDALVLEYTSSIGFDVRLGRVDILGSIAHAQMLSDTGIITELEGKQLIEGLNGLLADLENGQIQFRTQDEDIHMNIERYLYERVGPVAGKLHTARSRNDQVALDMHLYLRDVIHSVVDGLREIQAALFQVAERHVETVIPGYTHLQRAQPISLAHHLLAYFWMFERDVRRFCDMKERTDMMPLGAGALAGTTFPISREHVALNLGFQAVYENSLDAVSDRDYLLEFLAGASIVLVHLSRFAEELILWSSEEFGFIELHDAYTTGSSMMPQKKNPDVAELVRGKTGRVFGNLVGLLTVLKGLPLAYNKDLQEDKEGVFDTIDTLLPALTLFAGMIRTLSIRRERLNGAFANDFSNATDAADYLVRKGLPFREAHAIVGALVLQAISEGRNLSTIPFEAYHEKSDLFDHDIYQTLDLHTVVNARSVRGGTGHTAVSEQLERARAILYKEGRFAEK